MLVTLSLDRVGDSAVRETEIEEVYSWMNNRKQKTWEEPKEV